MNSNDIRALICGSILLFAAGMFVGAICQERYEQGQAIEHGTARYNPETGTFEWLEVISAD